jgi:hypothetical protein
MQHLLLLLHPCKQQSRGGSAAWAPLLRLLKYLWVTFISTGQQAGATSLTDRTGLHCHHRQRHLCSASDGALLSNQGWQRASSSIWFHVEQMLVPCSVSSEPRVPSSFGTVSSAGQRSPTAAGLRVRDLWFADHAKKALLAWRGASTVQAVKCGDPGAVGSCMFKLSAAVGQCCRLL